MKKTSRSAIADASAITRLSPYKLPRYAPIAGLVTKLAANVADTLEKIRAQPSEYCTSKHFSYGTKPKSINNLEISY